MSHVINFFNFPLRFCTRSYVSTNCVNRTNTVNELYTGWSKWYNDGLITNEEMTLYAYATDRRRPHNYASLFLNKKMCRIGGLQ